MSDKEVRARKWAPSSGESRFSARYNSCTDLFWRNPAVNKATGLPDRAQFSSRRQRRNVELRSARENGANAEWGKLALLASNVLIRELRFTLRWFSIILKILNSHG